MNKKVDYAFKSYVLNEHSDLVLKARQCSLYDYSLNKYAETGEINAVLKNKDKYNMTMVDLSNFCLENGLEKELNECLKINNASYKRTQRLRQRIKDMLTSGKCIFVTLTFNDNTLNNTTYNTRRTFVTRYLKQYNSEYIANVDYGKQNHREHYHAIIKTNSITFEPWRKYGNINTERIRNKDIEKDNVRLAKYICKLSNHAIKETTKRTSLIYSR